MQAQHLKTWPAAGRDLPALLPPGSTASSMVWERACDLSNLPRYLSLRSQHQGLLLALDVQELVRNATKGERVPGQIYLLQCQKDTVSLFTSLLCPRLGLAHTSGVLGMLHGPPWHSRARFLALPVGRWGINPASPHKSASGGLTVSAKRFASNRAAQLSRTSCSFMRDAGQKNLLRFLFQQRAWRQPDITNRSYSLHKIHAAAVYGVFRAGQGCMAAEQGDPY